jgi:hypothetical protein
MRKQRSKVRKVSLPSRFGIEAAAELHARLAPHVAARGPVELEVAAPARVHTAALQVLAAFFRTRTEAGRVTRWRNPPAVLRDSASQLGLDAVLGLAATLI